jgi:hypothetical protein
VLTPSTDRAVAMRAVRFSVNPYFAAVVDSSHDAAFDH